MLAISSVSDFLTRKKKKLENIELLQNSDEKKSGELQVSFLDNS